MIVPFKEWNTALKSNSTLLSTPMSALPRKGFFSVKDLIKAFCAESSFSSEYSKSWNQYCIKQRNGVFDGLLMDVAVSYEWPKCYINDGISWSLKEKAADVH